MSTPSLSPTDDGGLVFQNLAPWFVSVLLELPELFDEDQPDEVKERLYPEPSGDPEHSDEWKKYVHPELFALIASARAIVMKDLASLSPVDEDALLGTWQVTIPKEHVNAWISALNTARVTLGAANDVDEEDMVEEHPDQESWDERRLAVAKIHLLGWLQQMIIEHKHPPMTGFQVPDTLPPDL